MPADKFHNMDQTIEKIFSHFSVRLFAVSIFHYFGEFSMRAITVVLLFSLFCCSIVLSQESIQSQDEQKTTERFDHAITVGVLQGGGSLVGVDFEQLIGDKIGVQVGAGLVGFGAGVNYHFLPTSNSSAVSIQFWNQGTG